MTQSTADKVLDVLKGYKLHDDGHGKYRCNSPLRSGSDGQSFALVIHDAEHGAYDDKAGSDSGSLYELAKKLNIELPERAEVTSTKHVYTGLAEYAAAHGVGADVFASNGWSDIAEHHNRPALKFKTATGPRWRYIDGGKPPYWHEKGYTSCWYGLQRAIAIANDMLAPLVLVNGEASTLVGQHFRIAACCFTGSGERAIPDALLDELFKLFPEGEILIALDCDTKGRIATDKILKQFAEKKRAGVRGVDLMLGDTGDLADFCMLHRDEAAARMWDAPDAPSPPTQHDMDLSTLAKSLDGVADVFRKDAKLRKQEDIDLVLAQAQAQIERAQMAHAAPKLLSGAALYDDLMLEWDTLRQHPDPIQGLRSGIRSLDSAVGGFTPEVYVIYGATSMGKSWLAVSIARGLITQGNGLIVPTESDPKRWMTRLASSLSHVGSDRIETGVTTPEEHDRARMAAAKVRAFTSWLPGNQPTPTQIRAAALESQARHDIKWIIIDSASKMAAPGTSGIYDRTVVVSDGIQNLMGELGVPVIVTSQVGRDVAGRANKLPTLEDAYGGGAIEQNAGVVLGLYRHDYYVEKGESPDPKFPPGTALVLMLKNRWRGGGGASGVQLAFVGSSGFYELEREVVQRATA